MTRGSMATVLAATVLVLGGCGADEDPAAGLVATDDAVTVYTGEFAQVDVLANDRAPSGASLRLCAAPAGPPGVGVASPHLDEGWVLVEPARRATAGERDVTYTACAGSQRQEATLRVTVVATPDITVTETSRPGWLRATNPSDLPIVVEYGHPNDELLPPDGRVRIAPHGSATISVRRATIDWAGYEAGAELPAFHVQGQITGIELPPGVDPLPEPRAPGRT